MCNTRPANTACGHRIDTNAGVRQTSHDASAPRLWGQQWVEYHVPLAGHASVLEAPSGTDRQHMRALVDDAMLREGWAMWMHGGEAYPVHIGNVEVGFTASFYAPHDTRGQSPLFEVTSVLFPEDSQELWEAIHEASGRQVIPHTPGAPWTATLWRVESEAELAAGVRFGIELRQLLGHIEGPLTWALGDWFLERCHAIGVAPLMPTL